MRKLRYKYRIYPNKTQDLVLRQWTGADRWLWNHMLAREIEHYQETQKFHFWVSNSKHLTELRDGDEFHWLGSVLRDAQTETLKYLDRALKQSFKGAKARKGFPKFKKKKFHQGSFSASLASGLRLKHIDYDRNKIKLPKLGQMKIKWTRKLPSEIKTWTIKQIAGKWYISFVVDVIEQPKVARIHDAVGVDLNSKDLAVTSDAEIIPNPKFYAKAKRRLIRTQRQLSRKTKGSNNWRSQLLRYQRAWDRVKNQRADALHQLSSYLVQNYDLICLENLNVKAMQKWNGSMVQDAGFGILRSMIEYKADLYGKSVVFVDRFYPSSKTCHACGHVKQDLTLGDRVYHCDSCGIEIDRDLNAAFNILSEGMKGIGLGEPESTPVETPLAGDTATPYPSHVSLNQEQDSQFACTATR